MNHPKQKFVNVDELSRSVTIEQVLTHFGLVHEIAHRTGNEIRTRCFLNCGKTAATGDRALAIKDEGVKQWCCHRYECPHKVGGNLVGLIDLMLPGQNGNGRPRGDRFKEVLATLQQIAGDFGKPLAATVPAPSDEPLPASPKVNGPLAESPNQRARGLVNLHEKFITDTGAMNPAAASYFRGRPYLTSEVAARWRMGYLPRDTQGNAAGGTMRGRIVYQLHDDAGRVIGYCGRDPDFERKHADWVRGGRREEEPVKVIFPKGLHRGLLLYGEHVLRDPVAIEQIKSLGTLIIVEGPNDVIRLNVLNIPAVAICSNRITADQADKLAAWQEDLGNLPLTLLFDLDSEGESGMQQAVWELAQRSPVHVGWSRSKFAGQFRDRQPESLTATEWEMIRTTLGRLIRGSSRGDTPAA
jgi:5S rRNA maturation endonuclease (ribonuclease M5)